MNQDNIENRLTHIDDQGQAQMVDIAGKKVTSRTATARSIVNLRPDTLAAIKSHSIAKGDVFATARIAGIQAAKKCAELIPLCHSLMLSKVSVDITASDETSQIVIDATCKLEGKTGVEMEALTACSIAALTIYDMCKALDKGIVITETRLIKKTGGKSGDWEYKNA